MKLETGNLNRAAGELAERSEGKLGSGASAEQVRVWQGDVCERLAMLPAESVQCVVTSPPYWGLRDYGVDGQLGLEPLHDCLGWARGERCEVCHVCALRRVFAGAHRVLADDGVLWLNYGDCYAGSRPGGHGDASTLNTTNKSRDASKRAKKQMTVSRRRDDAPVPRSDVRVPGLKPKNLVGMAWRVAFALQADGWWLRSDCVWHKPNPMPESCGDRPTKSHEYVFLLTKSARYYYDQEAVRQKVSENTHARLAQDVARQAGSSRANGGSERPFKAGGRVQVAGWQSGPGSHSTILHNTPGVNPKATAAKRGTKQNASFSAAVVNPVETRNLRTVWTVATEAYSEAHFATFPRALARRCVLAGSRAGDVVLDPFAGSGTTLQVALEEGRQAWGIELNPEYVELIKKRLATTQPGLGLEADATTESEVAG